MGPVSAIYQDGFHDLFVANKAGNNIWQLRNGQVIKIFGSLHNEGGHINGEVDGDVVGSTADGTTWLRFDAPYDIYTHYGSENVASKALYIIEGRSRIRKLIFNTMGHVKQVMTVAGDNRRGHRDHATRGDLTRFGYPLSMTAGLDGTLYVADTSNHCIRKIVETIDTRGRILSVETSTFLGIPGTCGSMNTADGLLARFQQPGPIIRTNAGDLYIMDNATALRRIALNASSLASGRVCTMPTHIDPSSLIPAPAGHSLLEVSARSLGGACVGQSFPSRNHGVGGAGGRHVGLECSMLIDGSSAPWVAHASEEEPWFKIKFASRVRLHRMVWNPFGDKTLTSPQVQSS